MNGSLQPAELFKLRHQNDVIKTVKMCSIKDCSQ